MSPHWCTVTTHQFSSIAQSCLTLCNPMKTVHQTSLSISNSRSPPKPMSIESVMPSNHLILCCPLLLLPSIFPSIRVFSNQSVLRMRWPKYWSFSFNFSSLYNYILRTLPDFKVRICSCLPLSVGRQNSMV